MISAPGGRQLLVSLHDVAPLHLQRLQKAEALFQKLGVNAVQYLFVPDFHGLHPASGHREFLDWCRREHPFKVSWWLHGYYHLDRKGSDESAPLDFVDRLKRRFLTAGEGEFLALDSTEQKRRLAAGLEEFSRCFPGLKPSGFVAPAWLFKSETLLPLLWELDLPFTEDHHRIYEVNGGKSKTAPVITWATRTAFHKYGSLIVCPLRVRLFRKAPIVRVALHPHDFDHPVTVANIERVLRSLMRDREITLPENLEWC